MQTFVSAALMRQILRTAARCRQAAERLSCQRFELPHPGKPKYWARSYPNRSDARGPPPLSFVEARPRASVMGSVTLASPPMIAS